MTASNRLILPLLIVFIFVAGAIFALSGLLQKAGFDIGILLFANGLFFLLNILVFLFQRKALTKSNPNVFIRTVMAGMMLKMLTCAITVVVFVSNAGPGYSRKSVFVSLFIYLIYLIVEVLTVMKLNKHSRTNA